MKTRTKEEDEKTAQNKELNRERQERFRAKRSKSDLPKQKTQPRIGSMTRKQVAKKREEWAESKRKWRAKRHPQKVRRDNEGRTARKQRAKENNKEPPGPQPGTSQVTLSCTPPGTPPPGTLRDTPKTLTKKTLQNKTSMMMKILKTIPPNCYSEVLSKLSKDVNPVHKKDGVESKENKNPDVQKKYGVESKDRNPVAPKKPCTVTKTKLGKIRTRFTSPLVQEKREREKKLVSEFYLQKSRPLPDKRYSTKHGAAYLLTSSLVSAHQEFEKEHPKIKISFTKFTQMKPKNVRLLSKAKFVFCECRVSCLYEHKIQI